MPGSGEQRSSPIGSARSSGAVVQLGCIGHELRRDRVDRIGRIDQRRHLVGDRDREPLRDPSQFPLALQYALRGRGAALHEIAALCAHPSLPPGTVAFANI